MGENVHIGDESDTLNATKNKGAKKSKGRESCKLRTYTGL